jgi:hypothetical protein
MENNNSKAEFQIMQKWYKKTGGIKLPMSHHHLATVSTEYTALYAAQPPPVKPMFSLETAIA